MTDPRAEISGWAEHLGEELASARIRDDDVAPMLYAATADAQLAYEVLVVLPRVVALVLRPAGHAGGPIGPLEPGPARRRAAQLVGFAAQGDAGMVDAIARSALAAPDPLFEARETLWATLEVLAIEPVQRPDPHPQEGSTP